MCFILIYVYIYAAISIYISFYIYIYIYIERERERERKNINLVLWTVNKFIIMKFNLDNIQRATQVSHSGLSRACQSEQNCVICIEVCSQWAEKRHITNLYIKRSGRWTEPRVISKTDCCHTDRRTRAGPETGLMLRTEVESNKVNI